VARTDCAKRRGVKYRETEHRGEHDLRFQSYREMLGTEMTIGLARQHFVFPLAASPSDSWLSILARVRLYIRCYAYIL